MPAFDADRSEVIQSALNTGVNVILCPAEMTEPNSIDITTELAKTHKNIFASGGIHPHKATDFSEELLRKTERLAQEKIIHAVGEIGLDFHYNFSPQDTQILAFRQQLILAQKLGLPVIIHSREASQNIIDCIEEEHYSGGGVLHCFTGDWNFAQQMMKKNFYISFSGIVTFPKAFNLREVVKKMPVENLLIETDSPFLTPVPFRGKIHRNEPKFVKDIALFIAEIKNIHWCDFLDQMTFNFTRVFGIEISNV